MHEVARFNTEVYVPPHPEAFAHDADGNLDYDGQWDYSWDAENRLIAIETRAIAYIAGSPRQKLEFAYDSQGRRFSKKVYDWDTLSNSFLLTSSLLYIYDGWNLIAELNNQTSPFTLHTSYLWGLDLSGSLEGAGGVGGLFAVSDQTGSTAYPTYDGNGNVMSYYDAESGASVAEFEYGPFGELIRATGEKADDFNFRFSTKYQDAETGLLYYGYRYYDSDTGRWLSRDPIGENGGLNLYGMVGNNPVGFIDYLGLRSCDDIKRHQEFTDSLLSKIADEFAAGGTCAGSAASSDWLATAENLNLGVGTGINLKLLGGIAEGATTETYGLQYFSGNGGAALKTAGNVVGGIGIGIDVYQAADAYSSGDTGGFVSNTASAGLGATGLLIAGSNPVTAFAAGVGAVAIGAAEQGALARIDRRERANIESYCEQRNQLFQDALDKSQELFEEAKEGCCNQ